MPEYPLLQPDRRAPAPQRPFRDRVPELQLIQHNIDFACRGQPGTPLITCFWGVAGIGKSCLLIELERLYGRDGPQSTCSAFPTLAARLDVDCTIGSALWRAKRLDRAGVVRELWRQLAQQIGADLPNLQGFGAEELAGQFVARVTEWLAYFRPLLLLDTVDDLVREDEEAFFWLEEHLVEPLALTNRVLFVFASRGELRRWKRFQVRRRIDLWPLVAFDPLASGEAVGANAAASRALYRHAFGHPLATEYLARLLQNAGVDLNTVTEQDLDGSLKPDLVRTALERTTQHIFTKAPQPLIPVARSASVLRWVNVEPLRYLAQQLNWEQPADYHDLIGQLQACHLLYWNLDAGTYEFPSGVGPLLAHALELQDNDIFWTAHRAAYAFHRDHLDHYPEYLARYVTGAAYHGSLLQQAGKLAGMPAFDDWWQSFLAHRAPKDTEPWSDLVEALQSDEDLPQMMPASKFDALLDQTKTRAGLINER